MTHQANDRSLLSDYAAHRALAEQAKRPRTNPPELRSPRTLPITLILRTLALIVIGLVVVKCF